MDLSPTARGPVIPGPISILQATRCPTLDSTLHFPAPRMPHKQGLTLLTCLQWPQSPDWHSSLSHQNVSLSAQDMIYTSHLPSFSGVINCAAPTFSQNQWRSGLSMSPGVLASELVFWGSLLNNVCLEECPRLLLASSWTPSLQSWLRIKAQSKVTDY